jgi:hypothetical protein
MTTRFACALLVSLILTTSACSSSMNTPDIKQNPHPRQRYELIATIGAPGAFESVRGYAYYQVSNASCVPQAPLTGGRNMPNTSHDFELTRAEDGSYRGYFYLDQLKDEDYFGLGVCHWELMSAGPILRTHGQSFSPGLVLREILANKTETAYFKKATYLDQSMNNANAGSAVGWHATDDDVVKHPEAYFPITVAIKEDMP